MATPHSYIEIAFESVKVFSNDGELDESELAFLLGLALRDKVVDEDERRVLGKIFAQAESGNVNSIMRKRIAQARKLHDIP